VDNGGSSGGSFRGEHGPDLVEVTDVHKAGVQEVEKVVRERDMRFKGNAKIVNKAIVGRIRDSGK